MATAEREKSMDFKNYLQRKQQLQKTIHIVLALLDELQLNHIQEKLRNDQHKLADEKFTLVVIGEFSRGKSTFVNAMLGKPVLPSSKQPTTNKRSVSWCLLTVTRHFWNIWKIHRPEPGGPPGQ